MQKLCYLATIAVLANFLSLSASAQDAPATVPASFYGTYNLTFQEINPGSPYTSGQQVTMVLRSDNSMCIEDTILTSPIFRNGNTVEGIWVNEAANVEIAVSNLQSAFNEVNVLGKNQAPFYGQLTGSKTSDSEECSGSTATPIVTADMNAIFELAESRLPALFPPGSATLFQDQYVYRFYANTGIYLAFLGDSVLLLGGSFGNQIVNVGNTSFVLSELNKLPAAGSGVDSSDLWNLSITGNIAVLGITQSFSGLTLAGVPAPDLENVQEINEQVQTTLADVASNIGTISIDVLTNAASERSFRVQFSATANGIAVSYDLTYLYTR